MLYFIENENYRVGVESLGAELHNFIILDEQIDLIWSGNPDIWAGRAPNLFPIVGELPNQQYTYEGKTYKIKRHGFARNKEFKLVEEKIDKLVFELEADEETLEQYPFKFRFLVAYKLIGGKLEVTYLVSNEDEKAMYFSVGAHPGFNVPLHPYEKYTDYYIGFEEEETQSRYLMDENGLLNGDTERVLDQTNILPLEHSYFYKDAIVFKRLKSQKVMLGSRTNPLRIEVAFTGFPYLGIWAKTPAAPYVCIEPWCGVASSAGDSGELKEKEGINELAPKQTFERTFSVSVLQVV